MQNNFKLGKEVDLLEKYPKTKRDLNSREQLKSKYAKDIARKFGKDFFDGKREYGYGGFEYNEKYWTNVVKDFKNIGN